MDTRIFHFIKKEFLQLLRDPRLLFIALAAPIIQLIVFGYVASTDIKNVNTAVLDQNKSYYSRTYLQSFKNSGYFNLKYFVKDEKEMTGLLDSGQAQLGIFIPRDFSKKIVSNNQTQVLAIIDGTNSSAATIIQSYITQINFQTVQTLIQNRISKMGITVKNIDLVDLRLRVWYNSELKSVNFMVPAIFATILMMITALLTSASIVKEKENGTMEMLAVTPLKPYELILGKLLPYTIIAFMDLVMVFLVATLWFKVPMRGSVALLFGLSTIFLFTGLGLGVFISTTAKTLRQSLVGTILLILPSVILSGFIFPIANMPFVIQLVTLFIPVRYFLVIVRDIFLKGVGINYLWPNVWPLIVFGIVILSISILRFRKKIE